MLIAGVGLSLDLTDVVSQGISSLTIFAAFLAFAIVSWWQIYDMHQQLNEPERLVIVKPTFDRLEWRKFPWNDQTQRHTRISAQLDIDVVSVADRTYLIREIWAELYEIRAVMGLVVRKKLISRVDARIIDRDTEHERLPGSVGRATVNWQVLPNSPAQKHTIYFRDDWPNRGPKMNPQAKRRDLVLVTDFGAGRISRHTPVPSADYVD